MNKKLFKNDLAKSFVSFMFGLIVVIMYYVGISAEYGPVYVSIPDMLEHTCVVGFIINILIGGTELAS